MKSTAGPCARLLPGRRGAGEAAGPPALGSHLPLDGSSTDASQQELGFLQRIDVALLQQTASPDDVSCSDGESPTRRYQPCILCPAVGNQIRSTVTDTITVVT